MKKNIQDTLENSAISSKNEFDTSNIKTTDINILLNRVKIEEKKESNKKISFSVAVLTCSLCFGALIF